MEDPSPPKPSARPLGGSARLQGCRLGKAASVPVPQPWLQEPSHPSQGGRDQAKPWVTGSAGDPSPRSLKLLPERSRASFPTSRGRESPAEASSCADQPCKGCRSGTLPSTANPLPLCRPFCCACLRQGTCRALGALAQSRRTPGMGICRRAIPYPASLQGLAADFIRSQDLETRQTSRGSLFLQRLAQEAAGKEFAYQDCWRLLLS